MRAGLRGAFWVGLSLLLLSGCNTGGPGGSVVSLGGGIGGTGLSYGPITAFGSVFVNGVEFDMKDALANNQVLVDGQPVASQSALGLGMVVAVTGSFNPDHRTGTAVKIEYYDDLQGPVQSAAPAAGTLKLLNLTVETDIQTIFKGDAGFTVDPTANLTVLANLAAQGTVYVEVSGLWNPNGRLHATRIDVKKNFTGDAEIRGPINELDANGQGTLGLRGVPVRYQGANLQVQMQNGVYVEAYGSFDAAANAFTANRIVQDEASVASKYKTLEGQKVELQGLVANLDTAAKTFTISGVPMSYAAAKIESETGNTFTLANGAQVEIKGKVQNGVLELTRMEGENNAPANSGTGVLVNISTTPVKGTDPAKHQVLLDLNPNDPAAVLTVALTPTTVFEDKRNLGLPLNYDSAFGTTPVALQAGDRLEVDGYRDPATGVVTALRIEVKS
ncbi:MAG TPA: DUF5666 domain-containing protein [Gammaproteobacteria bacterium]|nr:DUF5666 domain-containing protein [Gammaproteobacteria bacterium]